MYIIVETIDGAIIQRADGGNVVYALLEPAQNFAHVLGLHNEGTFEVRELGDVVSDRAFGRGNWWHRRLETDYLLEDFVRQPYPA